MIKNYHCTNCGFNFKKSLSNKFIKSVRLECPSCGSHEVTEASRVNALVNKKSK